ncbi:hypothetical protein [Noviherbaspirillum sedimenti]|uniref:Uncharacterized protein n=1 Tax=Noviherbaspirillum sedimenti TaxID=2320865 RepID=A0A3A3FVT7_9BURK|nr:hypothetical protein [Noviherbaspirillum sedimenti]RJG00313.1 hypothetical protein D3878_00930 [Noviherbaspirillum sedimenti]
MKTTVGSDQGIRVRRRAVLRQLAVAPLADPSAREIVRTRHHERPMLIGDQRGPAMMAKAPVINHTDAELTMLENLVGRRPPFQGISYPYQS